MGSRRVPLVLLVLVGFVLLSAAMMSVDTLPAGFRIISVLGLGSVAGLALGDLVVPPARGHRPAQKRRTPSRPITPAHVRRAPERVGRGTKASRVPAARAGVPRIVFQRAPPVPVLVTASPPRQRPIARPLRPNRRPPSARVPPTTARMLSAPRLPPARPPPVGRRPPRA